MGDYTGGITSALDSISNRSSEEVRRRAMLQAMAEQQQQFEQQQQERQRSMGGRKVIEELLPQLMQQLGRPPAQGAQPPMPGQPSVPMAPPPQPQGPMGQMPPPPGPGFATPPKAAPAPPPQAAAPGAPPGGMPGMPPPPGAQMAAPPGAPPAAAAPPMPPQGWQGLPKPPAPPAAGPGGLPPPPEDAVMPRQQLSVGDLAKFLDSKGIKGADALAAIEQWKPYMDSQNKAELDAMKLKNTAQTAALAAYQRVLRDAETSRHHQELERQGEKRIGQSQQRINVNVNGAGGDTDLAKDPETRRFMAEQYWAGDSSVMQNLGRGRQGAANITALRKEIVAVGKEQGKSAKDLAAAQAEFQGMKAGERTLGTRTANVEMAVNEANNMADIVLDTSSKFPRSEFMPINKVLKSFEDNTGSTQSRQFGAAINSFINGYARAISPSGTPTVSDKDHAREILSTADSHEQVVALMGVLKREMAAAQKAPGQVRDSMRSGFTGKGDVQEFASEAEAKAAGLKSGTKVKINGVSGTWQ